MASQDIEFSNQGIKFSYNRFLADSAAGFLVILIAIITYYNADIAIQFRHNLQTLVSKEMQIFLCLLFFLLSTPLGLAINALSWAVLGWFQNQRTTQWVDSESFLIKGTKSDYQFKDCQEFFGITKNNWAKISAYLENLISVHRACLIESMGYVEGLVIFTRNLSLLAFILPIIYLVLCSFFYDFEQFKNLLFLFAIIFPFSLIFSYLMFVLGSFVSFYYDLKILSKMYIFCKMKKCPSEIKGDIEEIVKFFMSLNRDANKQTKV